MVASEVQHGVKQYLVKTHKTENKSALCCEAGAKEAWRKSGGVWKKSTDEHDKSLKYPSIDQVLKTIELM